MHKIKTKMKDLIKFNCKMKMNELTYYIFFFFIINKFNIKNKNKKIKK